MAAKQPARKLFAAALRANKALPNGIVSVITAYVTNRPASLNEAIREALETAKLRWPPDDGFFGHQVEVIEVPQTIIDKCCNHN